jgi:hypothetical protein
VSGRPSIPDGRLQSCYTARIRARAHAEKLISYKEILPHGQLAAQYSSMQCSSSRGVRPTTQPQPRLAAWRSPVLLPHVHIPPGSRRTCGPCQARRPQAGAAAAAAPGEEADWLAKVWLLQQHDPGCMAAVAVAQAVVLQAPTQRCDVHKAYPHAMQDMTIQNVWHVSLMPCTGSQCHVCPCVPSMQLHASFTTYNHPWCLHETHRC